MLHHISFSARHPEIVAKGLAKLLDCTALRAPCPPFPTGSWFVCLGDAFGTLLEVLPWGHVQDKEGGSAKSVDNLMRDRSSTHILLQTPRSTSQIETIANEEGWDCVPASAGFFNFTKVWVEGTFLVELITPEQAASYTANFGTEGMPELDGKLRELELAIMTAPNFVIANLHDHRSELLTLNVAYLSWVFAGVEGHFAVRPAEIIGMDVTQYVESVLDKICDHTPPEGIFYLVQQDGQFVGMGGLRGLTADLVEIKRIYVRPEFRGARLGEAILVRLMQDAARFGYKRVCLESAPFMKTAQRIYEAAGFVDRQPYPEAEVPEVFLKDWRFMERPLQLARLA